MSALEDFKKSLDKKKELLDFLNSIYFEFGIFEEDGSKKETVTIYNPDDTTSEIEMNLKDIMFFTEYGTITLPAKKVLKRIRENIFFYLKQNLNNDIISPIFNNQCDKALIISKYRNYENVINSLIIPQTCAEIIKSDSQISSILNDEDKTPYIFDLNKLKKYIKCKIFF